MNVEWHLSSYHLPQHQEFKKKMAVILCEIRSYNLLYKFNLLVHAYPIKIEYFLILTDLEVPIHAKCVY